MQLTYTHTYNGTPEQVVALMRNPEFISDVAAHAGATSHDVSVEGHLTRLRMTLPVPGNIAAFVGGTVDLTQTFDWSEPGPDGKVAGKVDVSVKGVPITVKATAGLSPVADGTRGLYQGDLSVKLPFIGGKVEKLVAPFIQDAFSGIERRAQEWLAREQA